MMKIVFVLFTLFLPLLAISQVMEGKIIYQQSIKIEIDESRYEQMTEEQRERMKENMMKWGKSKKVLVFTKNESLFRNFIPEKDAKEGEVWDQSGGHRRWMRMSPQEIIYLHHTDKSRLEQRDFFDKKFLITDVKAKPIWKITGKQEKVLDYVCQQATFQENDSVLYTAWFSPQIPVSSGPAGIAELPGMILKLTKNEDELLIEATEVRAIKLEESIEKPDKGKKVTDAEYKNIVEQKMKEMREEYGEGAGDRYHH